jgi:hypothetical protein
MVVRASQRRRRRPRAPGHASYGRNAPEAVWSLLRTSIEPRTGRPSGRRAAPVCGHPRRGGSPLSRRLESHGGAPGPRRATRRADVSEDGWGNSRTPHGGATLRTVIPVEASLGAEREPNWAACAIRTHSHTVGPPRAEQPLCILRCATLRPLRARAPCRRRRLSRHRRRKRWGRRSRRADHLPTSQRSAGRPVGGGEPGTPACIQLDCWRCPYQAARGWRGRRLLRGRDLRLDRRLRGAVGGQGGRRAP